MEPNFLPGRGRLSSAVPGFEYGLPRAKQRLISSRAGQNKPLRVCFLRFFPPIAEFAAPLWFKFPAFRFADPA